MSGWSESRRDLNPERADPREAARPYLHKAQVPAGSFATDRPTDRRYLARSRRAKGSFRQLPPTCMVAEITEGYRSMRHDSRGRRTERMGRERWLFSSFNCGTVEVRRQSVVEREEKGRNRYRETSNRPRQISGREFVTSRFPRASSIETLGSIRVHAFPARTRKSAFTPKYGKNGRRKGSERRRERNDFSLILRIQRPEAKTVVDRSFPGWR